MAAALTLAPIIVLGDVWDEPRVVDFRHSAGADRRRRADRDRRRSRRSPRSFAATPPALPIVAVAVLPLRVPLEIGGETANLLVPLYLVIAAGVITAALAEPRPPGRAATVADHGCAGCSPRPWSSTRSRRATPRTSRTRSRTSASSWSRSRSCSCCSPSSSGRRALLRRTLIAVALVASACALVAIYQYFARDLFLNPELFDANELHVYFRDNSIFFDPNVFGRYMALALTAIGACIAWGGARRELTLAARGLRARPRRARVQLLADQLRRPDHRAGGRRDPALELARRRRGRAGLGRGRAGRAGDRRRHPDLRHPERPQHRQRPLRPRRGRARARARTGPLAGWGSGAFGRAFYERSSRRGRPSRTPSRSRSPPSRGSIGLIALRRAAGLRAGHRVRRRRRGRRWRGPRSRPASARSCSTASATPAS